MSQRTVWTFFYGSYINFDVLKEVSLVPSQWSVARLSGFDIEIRPRANLVRSDRASVFGIVATATHAELARLYRHAHEVLGERYLPEAVLVETLNGLYQPALCYLAHEMAPQPAQRDYVERILKPARELGFPSWYVDRVSAYLP